MTANRLVMPPSSGLASRRKNIKKNLSLSLNGTIAEPPKTAFIIPNDQNLNAYPNGPIEIMPHLYLGSEKNTLDLDNLKDLSIHAILNVAAEVTHPYEYMFQSMEEMLSQAISPSPSLSNSSTISSSSSIHTQHSITSIGYHKLNWEHNQDNLSIELQKAIDIIDKARSAGQNILVHCQCGVARSATVVIAYVMKTKRLSMQEAYDLVKNVSPPISPNLGLLFQLREYEQLMLKKQIKQSRSNKKAYNTFSFKTSSLWKSRTRSLFYK